MKENGINKLIELLNEYESVKPTRDYSWRIERRNQTRMCGTEYTGAYVNEEETERIVISKKYKFIGRLVDNDKIDFELDSIIHKHKGIDFDTGKGIVVEKLCDRYESLLMLLAIQDNPIEFLCSVLK